MQESRLGTSPTYDLLARDNLSLTVLLTPRLQCIVSSDDNMVQTNQTARKSREGVRRTANEVLARLLVTNYLLLTTRM